MRNGSTPTHARVTVPGLSIVTPTQGRSTLLRLLENVREQGLAARDEHIVVVDAHEMDPRSTAEVMDVVTAFGDSWRALAHDAGCHTWGHNELNEGIRAARSGNYLVFNDDDDVFAAGALDAVRRAIAEDAGEPRLHIFRFMPPWRRPLPVGRIVRRGQIGGHCIVTPNIAGRTGLFGPDYEGDYTYIEQTIELWGGVDNCVFHDDVIAITRP